MEPAFRYLFHVTPWRNLFMIFKEGLEPSKSSSVEKVWLCGEEKLGWALEHVAKHHKLPGSHLVVLLAAVPPACLKTVREGVYWTPFHIPPSQICYCCPLHLISERVIENVSNNHGKVKGGIYGDEAK